MPKTAESFPGFSPQALKFLRDLKKNNDRTWFSSRKELYERECLEPLRTLTIALARDLRKARVRIEADASRVGFRIYRDVRFSRDKSPYKTNLGTYLPHRGVRGAPGGHYVHVAPKSSFVAVGFYQLDRDQLARWREAMARDPKRFQTVLRALARNGVELAAQEDALKRMPRGFEAMAESPIASCFKLSSFMAGRELSDDETMSEALVAESVRLAKQTKPLLEYGWSVLC
jgi:uncharacterized protein (TIGR02453 family)